MSTFITRIQMIAADASQAALTAEAAQIAALKEESDVLAQTSAARQALRLIVLGVYSGSPDDLAVFGLKPRKASSETVARRAEAAVKAKATRQARGTMGPKQKLAITGATAPATTAPAKTP